MSKKYQAAVPAIEWYVCNSCGKESGRVSSAILEPLTNSEIDIPAGWSRLTVRSTEPLEDDHIFEFCGECTQVNSNR